MSNLVLGTSSSRVAFPLTSRPAAPPSRAARIPAPPRRAPATVPPVPPAVRRHRVPHGSTTTHARRAPCLRPFLVRPTILQHDPGLAASPPVRYTLRVARREISLPCLLVVRCGLTPVALSGGARRRGLHVVRPVVWPIGLLAEPLHDK